MFTSLLSLFSPLISTVLERVLPEDKQKVKEIEAAINLELIKNSAVLEKGATQIILAEAKSEHWLTANWRPLLMLVIISIIAWNYLIAALLNVVALLLYGQTFPLQIDLPQEMWTLLTIGTTGYVAGRSFEKVAENININRNQKN